jgi:hypothetical protein
MGTVREFPETDHEVAATWFGQFHYARWYLAVNADMGLREHFHAKYGYPLRDPKERYIVEGPPDAPFELVLDPGIGKERAVIRVRGPREARDEMQAVLEKEELPAFFTLIELAWVLARWRRQKREDRQDAQS